MNYDFYCVYYMLSKIFVFLFRNYFGGLSIFHFFLFCLSCEADLGLTRRDEHLSPRTYLINKTAWWENYSEAYIELALKKMEKYISNKVSRYCDAMYDDNSLYKLKRKINEKSVLKKKKII